MVSLWKGLPEETRRDILILAAAVGILLGAILALVKYTYAL